jgi:hypothetical protein
MTIQAERRVAAIKWLIKARWFYPVGVLFIGFLTKIISGANVSFSYTTMASLFIFYIFLNLFLWLLSKRIGENFSFFLLNFICYGITITDFIFITLIIHMAGGVESVSHIFMCLVIVGSSLFFGARGSVITAIVVGLIINGLVVIEYYGYVPHISRYGMPTIEFTSLPIGLTKTITASVFYIIIGFFSGYSANMLFKREESFEEKAKELDAQARIIKKSEEELAISNAKLDERNQELERFQKLAVGRELKMIELKEEMGKLIREKNNQT